ncbi:protein FAR-RED ELONGATED HYPOCOTYL 3-like [Brachypodium distachyon]|uniref:protein FAR-RED ELONGATED HYPOCOTYL 3-like n=1 Tax=Brachypodium distachyon TaxID=15368 RepID=UPI00071DD25D|nr:protein FAR-RED ELONGATED HYPOCOTYL 3-like [Brachypodium distachyon]|eukprot:XP_014756032.1 protein FAR-RED ELONGATED HYPOCOTYL 3-like [Brachypodium distachyon]
MRDFDLNECPVELNIAVGTEEGYGTTLFPLYCTQKLPNKDTHQHDGDCGESHNANANAVDNLIHEGHVGQFESSSLNQQSIDAPGEVHIEEQYDGEEALSQPQEPFLGMRFDTLLCARNHYNAYALKLGFSIRSNTSRRSFYTNEVVKQQFVCNKFRKPKPEGSNTHKPKVAPAICSESGGDSDEESELDEHAFAKGKKVVKKRRRETIKQTNCKARMMVKLIDSRWEVTYFIGEHNHPLIAKPSLTKYLRSH